MMALFGRNILQLPLQPISLGYKKEKVRLVFELKDSPDLAIQTASSQVCTGSKWNATQADDQNINRLKHQEIVGFTQPGRVGLGWGTAPKRWSKATKKERTDLVISEAVKMDDEGRG